MARRGLPRMEEPDPEDITDPGIQVRLRDGSGLGALVGYIDRGKMRLVGRDTARVAELKLGLVECHRIVERSVFTSAEKSSSEVKKQLGIPPDCDGIGRGPDDEECEFTWTAIGIESHMLAPVSELEAFIPGPELPFDAAADHEDAMEAWRCARRSDDLLRRALAKNSVDDSESSAASLTHEPSISDEELAAAEVDLFGKPRILAH